MTPLRKRMIEDMQLRGLSERTQTAYVLAVRQLAEHYDKAPDQITEEELRQPFSTSGMSDRLPLEVSLISCWGKAKPR